MSAAYHEAEKIVENAGMTAQYLPAGNHILQAFTKISKPGRELTIYLEGDGLAWRSRFRLSSDPTPRQPLVLELAALDPSANVAYLARPCQYVMKDDLDPFCTSALWSSHRFSTEVVRSMDAAINLLKKQAGAPGIHLIGYSGGGAVAVLIAAHRDDVLSLRTLAGNLDHQEFSRQHRVTPLTGSLNPIDFANQVETIPQLHFVAENDRLVSGKLAAGFLSRQSDDACSETVFLPNVSHQQGWRERWPALLQQTLPCRRGKVAP